MRRLSVGLATAALTFAAMGIAATADAPPRSTFVVVLNADEERPPCAAATNASRGVAVFRVTNESTGAVEWKLVANNIPGTTTAGHIHIGPAGTPGPVVQPLAFTPGEEGGTIMCNHHSTDLMRLRPIEERDTTGRAEIPSLRIELEAIVDLRRNEADAFYETIHPSTKDELEPAQRREGRLLPPLQHTS